MRQGGPPVLERGAELGIGGFLVVRDEAKGLRVAKREPTMGLRGIPEGEIVVTDHRGRLRRGRRPRENARGRALAVGVLLSSPLAFGGGSSF